MPVTIFSSRRPLALACALGACIVIPRALPAIAPALEEGLPLVEHVSPEDFHGFGQVSGIAVGSDGTLAFAAYGAVYLYDHRSYVRVAVPAAFANMVTCDARGGLWTCGDRMVGTIENDPGTGAPRFVSQVERLPAGHRDIGILRHLAAGKDGTVFALSDRGIARFAPDGEARWFPLPTDIYPRMLAVGSALVHASNPTGVSVLEGNTLRQIAALDTLPAKFVALLPGGPDRVGLLTLGGGLFDCALTTGRITPHPTPIDALLRAHPPSAAFLLDDGRYALALAAGGLMIVESDWTRGRIFDKSQGLASSRVNSAGQDHEGGLWLATNNGLTRLHLDPAISVFDERSGLTANGIFALVRHEGELYVGGADGLLRLVPADPADGTPAHFIRDPRSPINALALFSHRLGLLVGTSKNLVLLPTAGPAQPLFDVDDSVQAVFAPRHDPDLIYVLTDRGLYVLRAGANAFATIAVLGRDRSFWSAGEAADGTLWFGSRSDGITRLIPPADGDWSRVQLAMFPLGTAGLPAGNGWTAAYSAFGEMQFLADDGTHRWDAANSSFPIDPRLALDGQHDVRNFPLVTDATGRVWTSPWHGLAACSRPLGWFDAARNWHDAPAAAVAAVGYFGAGRMLLETGESEILWAKSNNALVRLDLAVLRETPVPDGWRPSLRSVHAAGAIWPLTPTAPALLPFSREPISFIFAAPRFGPGAAVRYRTRLLGFDPTWSPAGTDTERDFTNLSGGPFVFEVQAFDSAGHASETARYPFAVTPPWHRRPLSYALYLLVAAGGVLGFVRWRLGRAAREQRRLERLVATRTAELATARDQAEAASRTKSAFLASMSHELRTPLNGVIGYAQLLEGDARLAPDQRERLRIVHQSGEHLLRMINDVLDLAKIEAGKLELRLAPFAPAELARDVAAAHAHTAAAKRLTLRCELAADLPAWVEGDAQKLRQVLDNLLGNAVKFTARGTVTLSVSPTVSGFPLSAPNSPLIRFSVSDTGPGISAADQARLFQPFEQAHATRPAAPGTGLGLAISRAMVERMGGKLALTSAPTFGSTFSFALDLPTLAAPAIAAARPAVTGYEGRRRRVLIVDDHAINRSLLADLLGPLGFVCVEADSGTAALSLLASGHEPWPDLAIVDLRMDGLDGLELTRRLRAQPRGRELRVLLTSASVLSFNSADAHTAGCDDFLPKPFRTAELVEKIGTLLALRWHEVAAVPAAEKSTEPIPAEARAALRDVLAQGDLEAFRAALARVRAEHPAAAGRWDELDTAAAGYQLSRLRALLDQP